jgi:hypothetical protein
VERSRLLVLGPALGIAAVETAVVPVVHVDGVVGDRTGLWIARILGAHVAVVHDHRDVPRALYRIAFVGGADVAVVEGGWGTRDTAAVTTALADAIAHRLVLAALAFGGMATNAFLFAALLVCAWILIVAIHDRRALPGLASLLLGLFLLVAAAAAREQQGRECERGEEDRATHFIGSLGRRGEKLHSMRNAERIPLVMLALLLTGCPGSGGGGAPGNKCEKAGVQCQLTPGTIGVCSETPCEEGKMGPCLKCTSQH